MRSDMAKSLTNDAKHPNTGTDPFRTDPFTGAAGGGMYGTCMIAYRKACDSQKADCDAWNQKHGF